MTRTVSSSTAAIYARYSTDRQDARSIDDQVRRCRAYADQHGHIVTALFSDAAESGAHLDRADMQKMLSASKQRPSPFSIVLVDDLSRLSRDLGNTWRIIFEDLASARVRVIDVNTGMSSDGAGARLTFGALALVNDTFLQLVRTETHRGLEGRAIAGFWAGGRVFGYSTVVEDKPPDPEHPRKLAVIDPDQADIVRRVFHLFVAGMSLKKIAVTLNEDRIAAPHDGGRGHKRGRGWGPSTIRAILSNERYTGKMVWNRRKWVSVSGRRGRRPVARPEEEWVVKQEDHLRIVPHALWAEVQRRWSRNPTTAKRGRPAGTGKYISLLSGLLRCGVCDGSMTVVSRKIKNGVRYSNFGCTSHTSRGGSICSNSQMISERRAVAAIIGALRLALTNPELVRRFTVGFRKRLQELYSGNGAVDLDRQLREAEARVNRIADAMAQHGWSEILGVQLRTEEEALAAVRQRRAAVEGHAKVIPHPRVIEGYLNDLLQLLEVDPARGRELLVKHLGHFTLTPEKNGEVRSYRISGAFNLTVMLSEAQNKPALATVRATRAGNGGSGGRI